MRVVYATAAWSPHDYRFLQAIVEEGHRVWFSSAGWHPDALPLDLPPGVDPWPLAFDELEGWPAKLTALDIDMIHAGPIPSIAASLALSALPCPLVVMSWGSDMLVEVDQCPKVRERAQLALAAANAVLADCQAVVARVHELSPGRVVPCVTFPWGLELERFVHLPVEASADLRRSLGWDHKIVLISTRSWEPGYGIETLLDAFAIAVGKNRNLRLILVSDGSLSPFIRKRLEAADLHSRVHCPGRISEMDLSRWFGAADLYVSTALSDGASISLLEAMACERPAIARNRYGNLEWIENGKTGWLVDCTNPLALAECIGRAVDKKDAWSAMGHKARQVVFGRADWSANISKISLAYKLARQEYERRQ